MAGTTPKASAPKKTVAKPAKAAAVDAKATVKKAAAKETAPAAANSKPAAPAAAKKTPPRKPAEDKVLATEKVFSDEQRYRMIAEAAYFRAESCHFKSDPVRDWIEAERDIAILLGETK
jgi:hypothetical protein